LIASGDDDDEDCEGSRTLWLSYHDKILEEEISYYYSCGQCPKYIGITVT